MVKARKLNKRKAMKRKTRNTRIMRPRMRVATIPAAVNTASTIRSTQPGRIQQTNTDRLLQTTIPSNYERGSVVLDQIVTSAITDRLRTQASLFQRIRYKHLTFEVQTQTATTTTGGYTVAFFKDPMMEVGSGESALKKLTAVQGAKTSKWWQSTVLEVHPNQMQYYCANGSDLRWFSPGRFVILTDGPPNETVSVTVIMKWTVELTEPAMQQIANTFPQAVLTATQLQYVFGTDGNKDGRLRAFNRHSDGTYNEVNIENAFSGLPPLATFETIPYVTYQLPYPIATIDESAKLVNCHFIRFAKSNVPNVKLECDLVNSPFADADYSAHNGSEQIIFRGTAITPISASEFVVPSGSVGFWMTQPSISVNQQSMISKKYQTVTPIESSKQSITPQTELLTIFPRLTLN